MWAAAETFDIAIREGRIAKIKPRIGDATDRVIAAGGGLTTPSFANARTLQTSSCWVRAPRTSPGRPTRGSRTPRSSVAAAASTTSCKRAGPVVEPAVRYGVTLLRVSHGGRTRSTPGPFPNRQGLSSTRCTSRRSARESDQIWKEFVLNGRGVQECVGLPGAHRISADPWPDAAGLAKALAHRDSSIGGFPAPVDAAAPSYAGVAPHGSLAAPLSSASQPCCRRLPVVRHVLGILRDPSAR